MSEREYKITARVEGMKEPFVDWYYGRDEAEARAAWAKDGLPVGQTTLTVEESKEPAL